MANHRGSVGTSMSIERRPRRTKAQRKKAAKARYYSDEKKIGKDAMRLKKQYEKDVRNRKRSKPVAKSDVVEDAQMLSLKERAIAEGKYLSR